MKCTQYQTKVSLSTTMKISFFDADHDFIASINDIFLSKILF